MKIIMSVLVAVFFLGGQAAACTSDGEVACPCYDEKYIINMVADSNDAFCNQQYEEHHYITLNFHDNMNKLITIASNVDSGCYLLNNAYNVFRKTLTKPEAIACKKVIRNASPACL